MSDIVKRLHAEERRHRDGVPSPRRDVADLMLAAADEIERLRALTAWPTHGCAVVRITADEYEAVKADLVLEDFLSNPSADWSLDLLNDSADARGQT